MNATETNGASQRKTLASQLDRLDTILDVLGDGLNEAVADAVKAAVGGAVRDTTQAVLAELLTNPVVLARLRDALAPLAPVAVPGPQPVEPPPAPTLVAKVRAAARGVKAACGSAWGKVKGWCGWLGGKAKEAGRLARPHTRPLLLAAGVGLVFGVAGFFCGPWCAAAAAWLAGFVTTLGVQAAIAFRRLLGLSGGA